MNPMTLEKFLRIKNKYGNHASWAIWADETDAPKSRMNEISFFDVFYVFAICWSFFEIW